MSRPRLELRLDRAEEVVVVVDHLLVVDRRPVLRLEVLEGLELAWRPSGRRRCSTVQFAKLSVVAIDGFGVGAAARARGGRLAAALGAAAAARRDRGRRRGRRAGSCRRRRGRRAKPAMRAALDELGGATGWRSGVGGVSFTGFLRDRRRCRFSPAAAASRAGSSATTKVWSGDHVSRTASPRVQSSAFVARSTFCS